MKERCQGWTLKLAKVRVARGASVKSSRWSHVEGADKGRSHTHIDTLGIMNLEDEELRDLEGEFMKL
jgi:hypothetical protein